MQPIPYHSSPPNNFQSLFEKSWEVFSKYLSRYQFALGDPSKSPRKSEIAHAILNKGKKGACTFQRPKGCKIVLRPLHDWAFKKAITDHSKLYYVSYGQTALLYFDIDLHNTWQTEEQGQEAERLIESLFRKWFGKSVVFWANSKRGFNGYLKVNRQWMSPEAANAIFTRLEHALRLFLAYRNNLADFEIKGKFGYMKNGEYQWAKYGKLPIHDKNWNFPKLQEFTEKPTVLLARVKLLCDQIEKLIPQDVLNRHNLHKKSLGDEPITRRGYFLVSKAMREALEAKYGEFWREQFGDQYGAEDVWLSLKYHRPGELPVTLDELRKAEQQEALEKEEQNQPIQTPQNQPEVRLVRPASIHRGPVNLDFSDLIHEPDSFKRQKEALLRYSRYLKRVPNVEGGMQLLHDNRLFSGNWNHNENKRRIRVQSILNFIAQTFDASKCAKGSVNVGKYDEWAKNKFPNGFTGGRKRYFNEDGKIVRGCHCTRVGPDFIAVFMSIAEFALLTDKNKDGTFPHKRAKKVWKALILKGLITVTFCDRKWAVCRESLVQHGIINITDRNYGPGKAMKWEVGRFFPGLDLWKGEKSQSLSVPLRVEKKREEQEHNTLLYKQPGKMSDYDGKGMPRPPPLAIGML